MTPPPAPHDRRRLYVGVAVMVLVVALVVVGVVAVAGDEGDGASGCVTDLVDHLPAAPGFVTASDLGAARAAGYDDSSVDEMLDSSIETGVAPDPLTRRTVQTLAGFDDAPYNPGDVECWVGDASSFVARGAFDAQRVDASGMELRLDGDLVTDSSTDPDLLTPGAPPAPLVAITDALAAEDTLSYLVTSGAGDDGPAERWSGVGLARSDRWDMVVAWSFPDDAAAATGEAAVLDTLTSGSMIAELVEGDLADALERDGSVLVLRAPLAGEPSTWSRPVTLFDPALTVTGDD